MSGSPLTQFTNMLVRFFEELIQTFPEERDIKVALEAIQGARKINPGLIRDMFHEHVTRDLKDFILNEDEQSIVVHARQKISTQFNEILPALSIFDKHWVTLSESNRKAIWNYLKALVVLNQRCMAMSNKY